MNCDFVRCDVSPTSGACVRRPGGVEARAGIIGHDPIVTARVRLLRFGSINSLALDSLARLGLRRNSYYFSVVNK